MLSVVAEILFVLELASPELEGVQFSTVVALLSQPLLVQLMPVLFLGSQFLVPVLIALFCSIH